MIDRLLILLALSGSIALGWLLLRRLLAQRLQLLATQRPFTALVPSGRPAIVAFTLPSCVECRTRQTPALTRLQQQLGAAAQITTLRADDHGDLVAQLGIMTVPATVVLDATGVVRALNHGFADEVRLLGQLAPYAPER
jgi:thioredoxin-like negative regulator of GroEL